MLWCELACALTTTYEPLNVLTSGAMAATGLYQYYHQPGTATVFWGLVGLVGVGSMLFHYDHARFRLLDELPIAALVTWLTRRLWCPAASPWWVVLVGLGLAAGVWQLGEYTPAIFFLYLGASVPVLLRQVPASCLRSLAVAVTCWVADLVFCTCRFPVFHALWHLAITYTLWYLGQSL